MFKSILLISTLTFLLYFNDSFGQVTESVFPDRVWGTYTQNVQAQLSNITPTSHPLIKGVPFILIWKDLEPSNGVFDFQGQIGDYLEQFDAWNWNCYLQVWVAKAKSDNDWERTPKWLFNEVGEELVAVTDDDGVGVDYYPWYFGDYYETYWHRMIDSLGNYLVNLPDHLRKRILFVQCAEGSTGDPSPYKGDPDDLKYAISDEEWVAFRKVAWKRYIDALSVDGVQKIPLLINPKDEEYGEYDYLMSISQKAAGVKEGGLTHGYHSTFALGRVATLKAQKERAAAAGIEFFSRGEMNEWQQPEHWLADNTPQSLYWSSIYAMYGGITMWNLQYEAADNIINSDGVDGIHDDAILFCNKYANGTSPQIARSAFCALRRGLDVSDARSFPESKYGTVDKDNRSRYEAIEAAFSDYGAHNGDMDAAMSGPMVSRRRSTYNDVGWEITRGNWHKYIEQIDPDETSVGWWQIDRSIYGRFARGFEPGSGKDTMFFDLDDNFFGGEALNGSQDIIISVTYLDDDPGSWQLNYDASDGSIKTAMEISNTGSGGWKTETVTISDAYFGNRGSRGSDLMLVNTGVSYCRFHMLTVDKTADASGNAFVSGVLINSCPTEDLTLNTNHQLSASVLPASAGDTVIHWSSLNTDVATVDENGLVSAVSVGSAAIIVSTNEGGYSDNCIVHVIDTTNQSPYGGIKRTIPGLIEAEDYDVGGEGVSYHDDNSKTGLVDIRPEDNVDIGSKGEASNGYMVKDTEDGEWLEYTVDVTEGIYDITFYYFCNNTNKVGDLEVSLDESVLTIISGMYAQGDLNTQASLTIHDVNIPGGNDQILKLKLLDNGFLIDALKFTLISSLTSVTAVNLGDCPSDALIPGSSHQLTASVVPEDASIKTVQWSSSNTAVASVDDNGLITAISDGSATITVTTDDKGFTESCDLTVKTPVVTVTEVTMNGCPTEEMEIGSSHRLTATVSPADANDQRVFWTSTNISVATVNVAGLVTGVSEGSATITATSNDGGLICSCEITVTAVPTVAVNGVSLSGCAESNMKIDSTRQLIATVSPANAREQSVSWTSSNTGVASIDESGLITAISAGNSTITVSTVDGGFSDQCIITVDSVELIVIPFEGQSGAINVYPNPVSDKLHFILPESTLKKHIRIYNTNGQLLLSKETKNTHLEIDVHDFKTEKLLIIQVKIGQKTTSAKVLIE